VCCLLNLQLFPDFVFILWLQRVNLDLKKFDELDCVIQGIHFIDQHNPKCECYYFSHPDDAEHCEKVPYDFRNPYPYLVVNIGSGVSILSVRSPTDYRRATGTR
jgi:type II pantothenate kinase